MFFSLRTLIMVVFVFTVANSAVASTTSDVGSPKVSAGSAEIAARLGYSEADGESSEDGRLRSRIHLDYGFDDVYAARIVLSQDDRKDTGFEHESIKLENRFYVWQADDYGFDFGVRANYTLKDGDKKPNSVELGFYELIPLDPFEIRFNQIFVDEIGDEAEDGIQAEWRMQATHELAGSHRIGIESFHDFGNLEHLSGFDAQDHTVGALIKGDAFGGFKYEVGYRAGISESAPDHSFKLFTSRTF